MLGRGYNTVPQANFDSFAPGQTLAQFASSASQGDTFIAAPNSKTVEDSDNPVIAAGAKGNEGNPVAWWVALVGLLIASSLISEYFGEKGDFASVNVRPYNFVQITIMAIVGLSLSKFILTKYPVKGLSAVVLGL